MITKITLFAISEVPEIYALCRGKNRQRKGEWLVERSRAGHFRMKTRSSALGLRLAPPPPTMVPLLCFMLERGPGTGTPGTSPNTVGSIDRYES